MSEVLDQTFENNLVEVLKSDTTVLKPKRREKLLAIVTGKKGTKKQLRKLAKIRAEVCDHCKFDPTQAIDIDKIKKFLETIAKIIEALGPLLALLGLL